MKDYLLLKLNKMILVTGCNIALISVSILSYPINNLKWIRPVYAQTQTESASNSPYIEVVNENMMDFTAREKTRALMYVTTGIVEGPTLEEKYQQLGGNQYSDYIKPYLEIIDNVLVEKGLDENSYFVQLMFYIGMQESHWGQYRVSSLWVGREHPTGIFQFLPSTFRSVSKGDIFNAEHQIRAFITMVQNGRIDEFQTLWRCRMNCLSPEVKSYAVSTIK